MSSNPFDVAVPDADLEAPAFEPMPTGAYRTTLQTGSELASNAAGWKAIRVPFAGFKNTKSGQEHARALRAQLTYENPNNAESVRIGLAGIVAAAAAVGLTEPTVTNDGKPAQKLALDTVGKSADDVMTELASAFNSMAGTEVEVYVTVGPRKRHGQVVLKQDGTPFMDNEIKRVSAAK